ncbi:MAG TPA: 4Fe-4S dicluster domain-containing protein [Candidatus Methanomethylicus sp.]|nr:4Fe-4S dicluster domain-containing protein [Candidatus Methanomethylicus sp.]
MMIKISKQELLQLPSLLSAMGYRVIAPIRAGGIVKLAPLGPDDQPEVEYVRIINSPKKFLLPDGESLFRYRSTATITSYGLKIRFPTAEGPCPVTILPEYLPIRERLAFFGIHQCMVSSIRYLDKVMLSDPADPYYKNRREGMFIAEMDCDEGDEHCMCRTLGTYKIPAGYADIQMRKSSNGYLISAASEAGKELLSRLKKEDGQGEYPKPVPKMVNNFELVARDEEEIDAKGAPKSLEACTLCAACTVTCPTCYCMDIEDKFSLVDPSNVSRMRTMMSCQRKCYSAIAGGTAFLHAKEERFKWRVKHKFPFSINAFKLVGCTGCGNCVAYCPAGVDFREFVGRRVA